MRLSSSTSSFLALLDDFSGHRLARKDDLGTLLELGATPGRRAMVGELAFSAKFVSGVHGIMRRIGPGGDGYDNLQRQLSEQVEKAKSLMQAIVQEAPRDVQQHFSSTYFPLTQDSFRKLLDLLYDLSWYKNWLIDHPGGAATGHDDERTEQ